MTLTKSENTIYLQPQVNKEQTIHTSAVQLLNSHRFIEKLIITIIIKKNQNTSIVIQMRCFASGVQIGKGSLAFCLSLNKTLRKIFILEVWSVLEFEDSMRYLWHSLGQ